MTKLNVCVLAGGAALLLARLDATSPAWFVMVPIGVGALAAAAALAVPSLRGRWRRTLTGFNRPVLCGVLSAVPWLVLLAGIFASGLFWTQRDAALRFFVAWALLNWSLIWTLPLAEPLPAGRPRQVRQGLLVLSAVGWAAAFEGLVFGMTPFGAALCAAVAAGSALVLAVACLGRHDTRVNVLTSLAATLVTLVGVEIALRAAGIGATVREVDDPEYARRFYTLTPPGSAFVNQPRPLDEFGPALIEINTLGIRGPELSEPRADVLLIGDSFVEARQLPWDETLTPRLQAALASRGRALRVVGHGMRGWSPLLEWNWYLKVGRTLQPADVLLFFFWNDLWASGDEATAFRAVFDANGRPDHFDVLVEPRWLWYQHARTVRLTAALRDTLRLGAIRQAFTSAAARGAAGNALGVDDAERLARQSAPDPLTGAELDTVLTASDSDLDSELRRVAVSSFWPGMRPIAVWTDEQRRAAARIEDELGKFAADVRADGARFGIVYVPNPLQVGPDECAVGRFFDRVDRGVILPPDSGVQSWLQAVGSRHGIEVLDPSSAMREHRAANPAGPPLYLRADCHWSEAGHQFIADWVADWYARTRF